MTEWKRSGEWLELPVPNPLWKPLKPGAIEELAAILPVPRKYFLRLSLSRAYSGSGRQHSTSCVS